LILYFHGMIDDFSSFLVEHLNYEWIY